MMLAVSLIGVLLLGPASSFVPRSQLPVTAPYATRKSGGIQSPWGISAATQLASSNAGGTAVRSDRTSNSDTASPNTNNNNNNRSYDSNNNNRNYANRGGRGGNRTEGGGGGRFGGGGRGGGGVGPSLRLENPLKVQRIPAALPDPQQLQQQREERQQQRDQQPRRPRDNDGPRPAGGRGGPRSDGGRGGPRTDGGRGGGRGVASVSDGANKDRRTGGAGGGDSLGSGSKDFGRAKRVPGTKEKKGKYANENQGDGKNDRKASLRIGTGRKSRGTDLNQRRGSLKKRDRSTEKAMRLEAALERKTVNLPDGPLTVSELAEIIDEKPIAVIKFLMTDLGVMAAMTQSLDPATCIAVAEGFGKIVGGLEDDEFEDDDDDYDENSALASGYAFEDDDPEDLKPRPPVVTIMGHVDHGKTSLLDALRDTRVTAGEAGGITQHIAAYQVEHRDQIITFIDTPGHAAFTDMRERGANITDIVILVVAADDGVKQQTADSIVCARQAGVPVVVAINKCDLETADPSKVMTELTAYDILTEDFGGETLCSEISAKEKTNLNDLLDKVMLQAELQDLKANPDRDAEGIVIEAYVEKGLGTVATTLIKRGTLKIGDVFVAGETYGKVRALISTNDEKTRLEEVGPSTPVRVVGFEGVPAAGDIIAVVGDEQNAREVAESRQRIARERESSSYQRGLMSSVVQSFGATKQHREMCVVVKADVQGSAEALTRSLQELKLEDDEATVTIKVLVSQTGEVSKSDIAIASVTPGTTVVAFNVAASFAAMEDARTMGIPIEYYDVVYDAIESVESRMQEVLSPTPDGEYAGSALVQEVFNIGGTGNIAGSRCRDGMLRKGANVRVMRGDKILTESRIKTLRNFKAEVDSINEGNECGIGLFDFEDFQADDVIECYIQK